MRSLRSEGREVLLALEVDLLLLCLLGVASGALSVLELEVGGDGLDLLLLLLLFFLLLVGGNDDGALRGHLLGGHGLGVVLVQLLLGEDLGLAHLLSGLVRVVRHGLDFRDDLLDLLLGLGDLLVLLLLDGLLVGFVSGLAPVVSASAVLGEALVSSAGAVLSVESALALSSRSDGSATAVSLVVLPSDKK